jgi:hypothetical protein
VVGRPESLVAAIGMSEHLGVHDAAIEPALHGDGLALGDQYAIFAARSGVDQSAAAAVLHHELVAEDLGDVAPDRDRTAFGHPVDRGWLQQHHTARLPVLGEPRPACAKRSAGDQHDGESAGREAATREPRAAPRRWQRFRFGGIFSIGHDPGFPVIVVDARNVARAAKPTLNRTVQLELS